ncbi:hypothetical protein FVQ98_05405 [Ottowia sp. GY511]|uniref:Transmembrane protein n=2 Tax=Ottowia TaxID=219181 RepID=A0ABW4L0B8_9BURK|nr:hypothetical protein FVQ98_05405 [Ottowia sp. GY511]
MALQDTRVDPSADARRARFVRRSWLLVVAIPVVMYVLLLISAYIAPIWSGETVLALVALLSPWVFCALAWRYGQHYAHTMRWAWKLLSGLLAALGAVLLLGAVYLLQLGAAFGRA